MTDFVIYTANIGNYDYQKENRSGFPAYYIADSTSDFDTENKWKRCVVELTNNAHKQSREYKILGYEKLPKVAYYVWVDSIFDLLPEFPAFIEFIIKRMNTGGQSICITTHTDRGTVAEEMDFLDSIGKYAPEERQLMRQRLAALAPLDKVKLCEGGFRVTKNNPIANRLMAEWWALLDGAIMDQEALSVLAHLHPDAFMWLPMSNKHVPGLGMIQHHNR